MPPHNLVAIAIEYLVAALYLNVKTSICAVSTPYYRPEKMLLVDGNCDVDLEASWNVDKFPTMTCLTDEERVMQLCIMQISIAPNFLMSACLVCC